MFCDALDGRLVALARKALETGDVNHVLSWVRPGDEDEIRHAFQHALAVRRLGEQARDLADLHFFETLVRFHRAAEGAPYTGLKTAGDDIGPVVPAAEKALDTGLVKSLVALLTEAVRSGLHQRFEAVVASKSFALDDTTAGRRFVEAYERYIQYVDRVWQSATAADAHPRTAATATGGREEDARTH